MTSDPWGRHTSLCLQAEMDMITTDEGRWENGGSDIIGASLSEPHIDGTCVHLHVGGGGGSTYVPPFTIAATSIFRILSVPRVLGCTLSECGTTKAVYTLGVRDHRGSLY